MIGRLEKSFFGRLSILNIGVQGVREVLQNQYIQRMRNS